MNLVEKFSILYRDISDSSCEHRGIGKSLGARIDTSDSYGGTILPIMEYPCGLGGNCDFHNLSEQKCPRTRNLNKIRFVR